jgi:hypothetical protein
LQIWQNIPHAITLLIPEAHLFTDASPWGWGAKMKWKEKESLKEAWISQCWMPREKEQTSNWKELTCIQLALRHFSFHPSTQHLKVIRVHSDNTTAVFNIQRRSACASLLSRLKFLFRLVDSLGLQVSAEHIPGSQNRVADQLSRVSESGDYSVKKHVLQRALRQFPCQPTIDLFATAKNKKCAMFCSLRGEEGSLARDAFSIPWQGMVPLLHPPVSLISRCIQRVQQEHLCAFLIAPCWEGQVWTPPLRRLTFQKVILGPSKQVLMMSSGMRRKHASLPPGFMGLFWLDANTQRACDSLLTR